MCWKCKNQINLEEKIYRTSVCEFCGADLHSCRNCQFYDKGAHYDCRENISDFVAEKERANFCDFFAPKADFSASKDKASAAKNAFSALFGEVKATADDSHDDARDAFNALFGDAAK